MCENPKGELDCHTDHTARKILSTPHFSLIKIERRGKVTHLFSMPARQKETRTTTSHRSSITKAFHVRGRKHSAVLNAVIRTATREIQLEKLEQLVGKNICPRDIHNELLAIYGTATLSYSTVRYYRCKFLRQRRGVPEKLRGRPRLEGVSKGILDLRAGGTRTSVRKTARLLQIPKSTVHEHFGYLGARYSPIQKNPHLLTPGQKMTRMKMANEMLAILKNKKMWPFVITGDETRISLNNDGSAEWVFPGEQPTVGVKQGVGDKTVMLTVFFSTSGFHYLNFMPPGQTANASFFCNIFQQIAHGLPAKRPAKVWIHMDNARPHRAKSSQNALTQNNLSTMPHPPYSPDLTPSDFYLFGHLKRSLGSRRFASFEELEQAVRDHIDKIGVPEIRRVYNHWIRRLEACEATGGDYVHMD